jgi:dipeptidyl aminopeptidase/acylaminoacyl peptidase
VPHGEDTLMSWNRRFIHRCRLALPCLVGLCLASTRAADAGPPPLDAFFAGARVQSVAISPDAHYLSLVLVQDGRTLVGVIDLVKHTAIQPLLRSQEKDEFHPDWCAWANATRMLCGFRGVAADIGKFFPTSRLAGVNADGSGFKVLAESRTVWSQLQDRIIDWTPQDPKTVLVQLDESEEVSLGTSAYVIGGMPDSYPDVYALDVYTGSKHLVARQRAPIQNFATDGHGQVRLGYGTKLTKLIFFGRGDNERPWNELARVEAWYDALTFEPVAAIAGTDLAYAIRDHDGRRALWKIDLTDTIDPQLVFAHPEVDLDEPIWTTDHRLIGVSFKTDKLGVYYTDPDAALAYDAVRRALPGRGARIVDMTPDAKAFIVVADSDVAPPMYYVLDRHGEPARFDAIASAAPGLADYQLAPMQPISFAARDGSKIPGYLTRPLQAAGADKPPLIVMPHGGPYARDNWGYDPWVQFLASHGFAVLQVEFRGSTGYGTQWFQAGFQNWGGLPYDDVIDGTRWALEQGYGDPKRTCIVGAGYGGYLALLAATRSEGLFKCAASIAGVSDLIELRSDQQFFLNWEIANAALPQDASKIRADSPRSHAQGVNIPVLLIHGDKDYTVEVDHTKMMDAALKRASKPHETLIIKGTDHHFREDAARRTLFGALGRFLDAQLGGKAP